MKGKGEAPLADPDPERDEWIIGGERLLTDDVEEVEVDLVWVSSRRIHGHITRPDAGDLERQARGQGILTERGLKRPDPVSEFCTHPLLPRRNACSLVREVVDVSGDGLSLSGGAQVSRVKLVDHGRVLELSAMKEPLQDEVGDGRMEGEALRDACGDVDVSVPLYMRDLIAALLV